MRITDIMADFLDSIRAYEYESGEAIYFDERESSEFVDMYFNGGGKINIEKSNADGENNQKQIMKKYRLKQWYPSLPKDWVVGDVAIPWEKQKNYYHVPNKSTTIYKEEVENNPDFWELIEEKKPLFTTDDGVKIFLGQVYFSIDIEFNKRGHFAINSKLAEVVKTFKHESNADKYILWNKPLLNLKDIEVVIKRNLPEFVELKKLAEERSKE